MSKVPKSPLFFLYHIKESIEAIAIHIQEGKQSFLKIHVENLIQDLGN